MNSGQLISGNLGILLAFKLLHPTYFTYQDAGTDTHWQSPAYNQ